MLGEEEEEVGVIESSGAAPQRCCVIQFSSSPTSKQRVVCWSNWCCRSFQVGVMRATSPEASQLTHDHVSHVSAGVLNIFLCVFSVFLSSMWTVSKRPDRRPQ